jgi:hypothetical protein
VLYGNITLFRYYQDKKKYGFFCFASDKYRNKNLPNTQNRKRSWNITSSYIRQLQIQGFKKIKKTYYLESKSKDENLKVYVKAHFK